MEISSRYSVQADDTQSCDQAVWPWRDEQYRLWSLIDMLRFYAETFVSANNEIHRALSLAGITLAGGPGFNSVEHNARNDQLTGELRASLGKFAKVIASGRLPMSAAFIARLERAIERVDFSNQTNVAVTLTLVTELQHDLVAEVRDELFLWIPSDRRKHYEQTDPAFGEAVHTAFPEAVPEIQAANRCLALDEWTACVFHAMRVLEHGIVFLGGKVDLTPTETAYENWKNLVDQIEKRIRQREQDLPKGTAKSEHLKALSQAATQFDHFRLAWRNHVMHGRDRYDSREANEVLTAVRRFMKRLVTL